MKNISEVVLKPIRPERVIQFGEGGFLRGFVDWMLQKLNDQTDFNGSVVVVQPIEQGMCDALEEQNCVYTHIMRGLENGKPKVEKQIVDVISRTVKPYEDYNKYLELAKNPDFRFIFSNTTEAGIAYVPEDKLTDTPPSSYPAKLTALLYERFKAHLDGFLIIPCELIDKNGETLKEIVLKYARDWGLGEEFITWINTENHFFNTLVDRIVTGYPKGEKTDLEYEDAMLDTSELFHLWVIEGDTSFQSELPFHEIGLNVIWTKDELFKYRTRKVRILNGAHTALVPYAMLKGFDTVKECVDNSALNAYLRACIFDEIIPTLDLPEQELKDYAENVLERFANPFIVHKLSSIALNSVSKFKVRVLPSILEYIKRFDKMPAHLLTAFGALIRFYKTDMANDSADVVEFMKNADTQAILKKTDYWGEDLSFLYDEVSKYDH